MLYPDDRAALEASLLERPDGRLRSWTPGLTRAEVAGRTQDLQQLFKENPDWFDKRFENVLNHDGLRALGMVSGEHSWVVETTRATGDVITAAIWNQAVKDNPRFLKGLDGAVQFSDGLDVQANEILFGDVAGAPGTAGHLQRNGTRLQFHNATAARDLVDTPVTPAQGDIIYRDGSNWNRLAAGTSGQFLKTNGVAANPAWGTVSGMVLTGKTTTEVTSTSTSDTDLVAVSSISIPDTDPFMAAASVRCITTGGATGAKVGLKLNAGVVRATVQWCGDTVSANNGGSILALKTPSAGLYLRTGMLIIGGEGTGPTAGAVQPFDANLGATITSVTVMGALLGSPSGSDVMGANYLHVWQPPVS